MTTVSNQLNKFKLSRIGRKLQFSDDYRILLALPLDVPERTWAEILLKEENELLCFDICEEIVDGALRIGYGHYMEKQTMSFVTHCFQMAFFKLIDWHFYRHDPGEDPTAYPPTYIPSRQGSWTPDPIPAASPQDAWARSTLAVVENTSPELMRTWSCSESLKMPVVGEIPKKYWFPGKVNIGSGLLEVEEDESITRSEPVDSAVWGVACGVRSDSCLSDESAPVGTASEVLQMVTDYTTAAVASEPQEEPPVTCLLKTNGQSGSLHGAGDSAVKGQRSKRSWHRMHHSRGSSRGATRTRFKTKVLPPIDTPSSRSAISDCRLRTLRLETQYQIASEKMETPSAGAYRR